MAKAVLDSSALLAVINNEPGRDEVRAVIADALMSTVNLAEVLSKLVERGGTLNEARSAVGVFDLEISPFDRALAETTGRLRANTRREGLSLGDRACLALAEREGLPVLTTDRDWSRLSLGIEIRIVR